MNQKAYKDGIESVRNPKNVRIRVVQRAIRDCREMGWSYLESYFQGKLAAVKAASRHT